MTDPPSGKLYSTVTQYWPRIAAGLVVVIGLAEFVVGGLTADSRIEFYLLAWAGLTSGLWFLSERADRSVTDEVRQEVACALNSTRVAEARGSVPAQFVVFFDRTMGRRALSLERIGRSTLASLLAVAAGFFVWAALTRRRGSVFIGPGGSDYASPGVLPEPLAISWLVVDPRPWHWFVGSVGLLTFSLGLNILLDLVSIWETRAVLGWMSQRRKRLPTLLALDLVFTIALSAGGIIGIWHLAYGLNDMLDEGGRRPALSETALVRLGELVTLDRALGNQALLFEVGLREAWIGQGGASVRPRAFVGGWYWWWIRDEPTFVGPIVDGDDADWRIIQMRESGPGPVPVERIELGWEGHQTPLVSFAPVPVGLLFYSAFVTSAWLWLYAAAVLVSRVLLRMNSGVGFLLRVTDVEKQPFRSMGFVGVIILSCLFALGLPLVLL